MLEKHHQLPRRYGRVAPSRRVIALCLLSLVAGCKSEPGLSYVPPSREALLATTAARSCSGHWESSTIRLNGAIISTRECAE